MLGGLFTVGAGVDWQELQNYFVNKKLLGDLSVSGALIPNESIKRSEEDEALFSLGPNTKAIMLNSGDPGHNISPFGFGSSVSKALSADLVVGVFPIAGDDIRHSSRRLSKEDF